MENCLSGDKFGNLLFVNVRIGDAEIVALFDTGAVMTVIAKSLLEATGVTEENESLGAGNNGGFVRTLNTASISDMRIGDVCINKLKAVVTDDSDFDINDDDGTAFPAKMLLGWDVISRFSWSYSSKDGALTVGASERTESRLNSDTENCPVAFPEYFGCRFKAGIDTGHTGSMLGTVWKDRLSDIEYHEVEIAGIGSSQNVSAPYVKTLPLLFQNHLITLRDVDICDKIYGRSADMEALLGYDFLEGRDWQLDGEFRLP